MNYAEISKETISYLYKSYNSLKNSPLDPSTRVLIELLVSELNGCAYCLKVHAVEAKKLNVADEKLNALTNWQSATVFSDKEKTAFRWTEAVTKLEKNLEEIKQSLFNFYSEREIVDLTACISLMNALNRLAISLRD